MPPSEQAYLERRENHYPYRKAWRQTEAREGLLPTMRFTLAIFSVALTIMLAYVAELKVIEELAERHGRLSPAESLLLALMWWFIFGLPVIAGTSVGWRSPRHAASGAFFALAILALPSLPFLEMQMAGKLTDSHSLLQLLCSTTGQIFLLWLPIGWFFAAAAGFARKLLKRRRA